MIVDSICIIVSEQRLRCSRVTVIDVNDNVPEMDIPQGCISISEFHDIHDLIYVIKVKDADDPRLPNGRVKIKIISGNELGNKLIIIFKLLLYSVFHIYTNY